jgi:hypothetical protein
LGSGLKYDWAGAVRKNVVRAGSDVNRADNRELHNGYASAPWYLNGR